MIVASFGGTWTHEQAVGLVGSGLDDAARVLQDAGVQLPVATIVATLTEMVLVELPVKLALVWGQMAESLVRGVEMERTQVQRTVE